MPGITRGGGDGDTAGGKFTSFSENVFVNGKPVVRKADTIANHGKNQHAAATMTQGNSSILTNGKETCRAGHTASCGHAATGSSDVFIS